MYYVYRVSQKKLLTKCCSAGTKVHPLSQQAPTPLATGISTRLGPKFVFWLFLTKNEQDHALPSHVHVKIWPHSTQFWLGFLGSSSILQLF